MTTFNLSSIDIGFILLSETLYNKNTTVSQYLHDYLKECYGLCSGNVINHTAFSYDTLCSCSLCTGCIYAIAQFLLYLLYDIVYVIYDDIGCYNMNEVMSWTVIKQDFTNIDIFVQNLVVNGYICCNYNTEPQSLKMISE